MAEDQINLSVLQSEQENLRSSFAASENVPDESLNGTEHHLINRRHSNMEKNHLKNIEFRNIDEW